MEGIERQEEEAGRSTPPAAARVRRACLEAAARRVFHAPRLVQAHAHASLAPAAHRATARAPGGLPPNPRLLRSSPHPPARGFRQAPPAAPCRHRCGRSSQRGRHARDDCLHTRTPLPPLRPAAGACAADGSGAECAHQPGPECSPGPQTRLAYYGGISCGENRPSVRVRVR